MSVPAKSGHPATVLCLSDEPCDQRCVMDENVHGRIRLNREVLEVQISFTHPEYPIGCISPNLVTAEGLEQFPGFAGTGFLARREDSIYYITARHCLTKDHNADIAKFAARLHIPYALDRATESTNDYLQFGEVRSLRHDSDDIPGRFVDVIVLTVRDADPLLLELLLERAIRLPPRGEWLDRFVEHPVAKGDFEAGKGIKVTVIGYPNVGTASKIEYPECQPIQIHSQSAKFSGFLAKAEGPDRYKLTELDWHEDLNGFSGSPVIVGFRQNGGSQYALAGMLIAGGSHLAHFIRISLISHALNI
jgi:hypothetical protein